MRAGLKPEQHQLRENPASNTQGNFNVLLKGDLKANPSGPPDRGPLWRLR